ncbi:hypothetical protein RSAG8_09768, partial [Rhizoctonia solani AG-8 WAC10335]
MSWSFVLEPTTTGWIAPLLRPLSYPHTMTFSPFPHHQPSSAGSAKRKQSPYVLSRPFETIVFPFKAGITYRS